jgi:hypothetical protein
MENGGTAPRIRNLDYRWKVGSLALRPGRFTPGRVQDSRPCAHTKPTNTLCVQNAELMVHVVTTLLRSTCSTLPIQTDLEVTESRVEGAAGYKSGVTRLRHIARRAA